MPRFRATLLDAPGNPLRIEAVKVDPSRAGKVLVRKGAHRLCLTDLEVIAGQKFDPMPIVLDHEAMEMITAQGAASIPGEGTAYGPAAEPAQ